MAVLSHTRVLLDLDGCYIILVSSRTLIAVLYHTRVLLDVDGSSIYGLTACNLQKGAVKYNVTVKQ